VIFWAPIGAERRWPSCTTRPGTAPPDAAPPRAAACGWFRHRLGLDALAALLDAFDGAGIPVIPLKGPLLAEALWDDPGLRPFSDLDLLVHRVDVPRAVELLGTLGYRALEWGRPLAYELAYAWAACFVPSRTGAAAFPIDLHWGLVGFPAGVAPRAFDAREVWSRTVTEAWRARPVRQLGREDLLLYLALHLAIHHPLGGAGWLLDLALLIRRAGSALDWKSVVERARRWGVAGAVYFALRAVETRLAPGVPGSVFTQLRPYGPRGALLDRFGRRSDDGGRLDHMIPLLALDRVLDLARALAAVACPSPAWVRSRYATPTMLRGYRIHYGRSWKIFGRFVR
jgi:hypothetical protein